MLEGILQEEGLDPATEKSTKRPPLDVIKA